jgi:hypothetical protein
MPQADSNTPNSRAKARILQDPIIGKILRSAKLVELNTKLVTELNNYFITTRDLAHPGHFKFGVNTKFAAPRNDLSNVATAMARIQAYRDRVCEIQLQLLDIKQKLDSWIKLGKIHVYDQYGFEVKSRGANAQQEYFIDSLFWPLINRRDVANNQLEQVDAVLANLDKAHYNYKHIGDIGLKLVDRLEGGRTVTHGA